MKKDTITTPHWLENLVLPLAVAAILLASVAAALAVSAI